MNTYVLLIILWGQDAPVIHSIDFVDRPTCQKAQVELTDIIIKSKKMVGHEVQAVSQCLETSRE